MKLALIFFIFFISSIGLIFVTVEEKSHIIYDKQMKKLKESTIQTVSAKTYKRAKKLYIPQRSFALGRQEIEKVLLKEPIHFELNDSSLLLKSTLIKIAQITNHIKEKVALSIAVHTDIQGTAKDNLYLSQQRADRLKEYFIKKTDLPLIVAIGYGEAFSLKEKLIKINLKRIKQ